jgi:hypothetical protein
LKDSLRKKLPEYMIPNAIVVMDKLPLLPNGKIDKDALPIPEVPSQDETKFAEPKLPVENILADIWKNIMGSTELV